MIIISLAEIIVSSYPLPTVFITQPIGKVICLLASLVICQVEFVIDILL